MEDRLKAFWDWIGKTICKFFHKNYRVIIFKKGTSLYHLKLYGRDRCIDKVICNKCNRVLRTNQ